MANKCTLPLAIVVLYQIVACRANIIVFQELPFHQIEDNFRDMPSRFGDRLPARGLKGYLVVASPVKGCGDAIEKPPSDIDNFTGHWIVLIERYNCSFEEKIRNAQNASWDAAIVYNVDSNDLEQMSAKNMEGITMPSVFIGYTDGLFLAQQYTFDKSFYLVITNDLPFDINTHLLLPFIMVVAVCMFLMLVFMIIKCIKDRRRQRRYRLPSSSLNKIPTCKFTKGDPYETCAICLDDYVEGEKLRVLPCAHAYHCKCIDPWLTKTRRVCPVCKRKVFARDERPEPDSDSDTDADAAAPANSNDRTPLLPNARSRGAGGTFVQQRENPFQAARRAFTQNYYNTSSPNAQSSEAREVDDESNSSLTSSITSVEPRVLEALAAHRARVIAHITSEGASQSYHSEEPSELTPEHRRILDEIAAHRARTLAAFPSDHNVTIDEEASEVESVEPVSRTASVINFFRRAFNLPSESTRVLSTVDSGHSINNDRADLHSSGSVHSQYAECEEGTSPNDSVTTDDRNRDLVV